MQDREDELTMKTRLALITITAGLGLFGCAEQRVYVPMSNHTISVADHQEQDVLWVQDNHGKLYRCQNTQAGPKCATVQ
jgi:hypothetical protein